MNINPKRPMLVATFCVFFFCGVPLALSVPMSVWLIALASFIEGVTGQVFVVIWYTTLQKMTAPDMLSRVSAYDHLGSVALAPLGLIAAGWFLESYGTRFTLYICIAMVIVPTMAVLAVKEVRTLRTLVSS